MIKETELIKLKKETPESERKYRVGNTFMHNSKKYGNMICYVDARYVQDTLDDIVGPANWSSQYQEIKGSLYCEITICFVRSDGTIDVVSKMDCGSESNIEKEKGEASDAFKRAAVQFGIARDLYSSETYKVELNQYNGKWYPPKNWKPPTKGE